MFLWLDHCNVAPFVGAWIEIAVTTAVTNAGTVSLRSSERGLKLDHVEHSPDCVPSLRSSERGLKFVMIIVVLVSLGRSVRRSVD